MPGIDSIAKTLGEAALRARDPSPQQKAAEEIRQQVIEIQGAAFDRAAAYTNVIILAGYAGLFTLWAFEASNLTKRASALAAILLAVSLLAFVLYEIYKMVRLVRVQMPLVNLIKAGVGTEPEAFLAKFYDLQRKEREQRLTLFFAVWIVALAISVFAGLAASLLLLYNFVAVLVGWPILPP